MNQLPFDESMLYDHVFRLKRWPFVLGTVVVAIFLVITLYYSVAHLQTNKPADWELYVVTIVTSLFFVGMLLATWLYPKILMVGINDDGIFVRKYGMVLWSDIKDFDIGRMGKQNFLWIILHNPDDFFVRNKVGRLIRFSSYHVAISSNTIPIKLEKLLELLKGYHKKNL